MPVAMDAKAKLLAAGLALVRERGFAAATVDALCARAEVTKGAFFHHFADKEAFGTALAAHWTETTSTLFAQGPHHAPREPLDRLLAYVDFRKELIQGELAEFTCLAGTMLQEVYRTSPRVAAACAASILDHAATLEGDMAAALALAGRRAPTAKSLAAHTQTVIQGAFVMAKATNDPATATEALDHLRRYLSLLLGRESRTRK